MKKVLFVISITIWSCLSISFPGYVDDSLQNRIVINLNNATQHINFIKEMLDSRYDAKLIHALEDSIHYIELAKSDVIVNPVPKKYEICYMHGSFGRPYEAKAETRDEATYLVRDQCFRMKEDFESTCKKALVDCYTRLK